MSFNPNPPKRSSSTIPLPPLPIPPTTPLIGATLLALTILSCEILAQTSNRWIGGIPLPYISDTGGAEVGYYIFSIAGTVSTIVTSLQFIFLHPKVSSLAKESETETFEPTGPF